MEQRVVEQGRFRGEVDAGRTKVALGQPAMIIGGIAVIARGVPRHTIDIDATVAAANLDFDVALDTLATLASCLAFPMRPPSRAITRSSCSDTRPRERRCG